MTTYIALFSLTDAGVRAAKDSPRRLDAAKKLLTDMGGEMKQFYMVMGDFDFVGICEAPDDAVSTAQTLWSSRGPDGWPVWSRVPGLVQYPTSRADPAEGRDQSSGAENSRGIPRPKGGSRGNARRSKPEHEGS
jgi:uncharacterized protein with GYD domain